MSIDVCGGSTNRCRVDDELGIDHAEFEYPFGYHTGLDFKKTRLEIQIWESSGKRGYFTPMSINKNCQGIGP